MKNKQEYLNDLAEIRSIMKRSSRFLSLSGLSGIFAGVIALGGGILAWWYLKETGFLTGEEIFISSDNFMTHVRNFLFIDGLLVLVLALISAVFFSWLQAKKKGLVLWDYTTQRVLISLGIPLLSGGIFLIVLMIHNQLYLIAPLTLLFYGLALLNAGNYTQSEVRYLGYMQVFLGVLAAIFLNYGLYFWIFGFGILHIVYGVFMYWKYDMQGAEG
ncbi:MAG: hypothetical protein U9N53_12480 [Bacteroidota bacterium]|nr:hypothetical protein [Bacteroidota bacterium]